MERQAEIIMARPLCVHSVLQGEAERKELVAGVSPTHETQAVAHT
jgi:hypothetical protein